MSIPAILPKTMRAWAIDAHGGPEQMRLREVRVPMPNRGFPRCGSRRRIVIIVN